jgi:hypothetical protein
MFLKKVDGCPSFSGSLLQRNILRHLCRNFHHSGQPGHKSSLFQYIFIIKVKLENLAASSFCHLKIATSLSGIFYVSYYRNRLTRWRFQEPIEINQYQFSAHFPTLTVFKMICSPVVKVFETDPDPWIRTLDYGSGSRSCSFLQRLSRCQRKSFFLHFLYMYLFTQGGGGGKS